MALVVGINYYSDLLLANSVIHYYRVL